MRNLPSCAIIAIMASSLLVSIAGLNADWPMWRHDRENSGHSPLPGNMNTAPQVLWTYFVGGYASQALGVDLDGDGMEEVVYLTAGKLKAAKTGGEEIWSTPPLGLSSILAVEDIGADGSVEIVACVYSPSAIVLIDSETGGLVWNYSFPSPSSGIGRYSFKAADISPQMPGPELIVWPYKSEIGYAFGFPADAASGQLLWTAEAPETRNYPPPIAVADLDLDGSMEVFLATFERIYSFDGLTGRQEMLAYSPGINRNYGTMVATNLDEDPYPEIALLAPNLNEHLWIVDNDGSRLTQIWDRFFEYSYPDDLVEIKVTVDSVSDVDGDGRKEIVFSFFNQSADARWHTLIWDALTAAQEGDLLDEYLLAVADIDGDGTDEVITSEQHQRSTLYYSNISIRSLDSGEKIILRNTGLVMDYWAAYPLGTNTIANGERWMEGEHGYAIWANGSLGFLKLVNGVPRIRWVVRQPSVGLTILGTYSGTGVLASGNDGWLRAYDESGDVVGMFRTGGFLSSLVAADLDGDGKVEVIAKNSQGKHVVLEWNGSQSGEIRGAPRYAKFGKDGSFVVWDMDGNGQPEILVGEPNALGVLDGSGTLLESYSLPSNPYDWMVANITADSHWDLFVCCLGTGSHTAYTLAIDGASGRVLWTKQYGTYAGFMSVMDYDGNGLDDLVMREHFDFYIILGPTGEERKGTSICGYHAPILTDIEDDGRVEIVWGGGWGSLAVDRKYDWVIANVTFTYTAQVWVKLFGGGDSDEIYGKMPAVADVDGDGIKEVGIGNRNGTFHCFDGSSGRLEWNFAVGSSSSDVHSCDIDGDGLAEFLFGTGDGRLISLGRDGIEWEMYFGDTVGEPILCDLDGDMRSDILVPVMDGYVYALHIPERVLSSISTGLFAFGFLRIRKRSHDKGVHASIHEGGSEHVCPIGWPSFP